MAIFYSRKIIGVVISIWEYTKIVYKIKCRLTKWVRTNTNKQLTSMSVNGSQ